MENNINNIDKLFKDSLADHQSPYVKGAWENMEAMLDASDSGYMLKNVQRYILASVVGAILLAGSVTAYIAGSEAGQNLAQSNATVTENPVAAELQAQNNSIDNTSDNGATTDNIADASANTTAVNAANGNNSSIQQTNNGGSVTNNTATPAVSEQNSPIPVVLATEENTETTDEVQTTLATKAIEKSTLSTLLLDGKLPLFTASNGSENFDESLLAQHSLADSTLKAERSLNQIQHFYSWQFGLQAGGNFNRVQNNTSSSFQVGNGFMTGVFISKNFNRRWGFGAELNYLRSNNNSISRSVTQTTYFFERSTTNYFLVTKSFDYLQAPLFISYNINKNHRVNFGLVGMYMLNSRTEVVEQKQSHVERHNTTTTKKGVYEDMNRFNYGINIGYEYNLPGMYSLGLRYNQMFNTVTNNSFSGGGKANLPAHLQLYVKLNLTK